MAANQTLLQTPDQYQQLTYVERTVSGRETITWLKQFIEQTQYAQTLGHDDL